MKWAAGALVLLMTLNAMPVQAQGADDVVCATNMVTGATISEPRYFCEPLESTFFVQFDQFVDGLKYLEATFPDKIELSVIGESVLGRPIYFVEVTNEKSPVPRDQKLQVGYSASIHANEPAGREGMVRVLEDLAAGIGPYGAELTPLLDHVILNVWFPNPDSWATGDFFSSDSIEAVHECERGVVPLVGGPAVGYCSGFDRENALGVDLNRQFPTPGWILPSHNPMNEPESRAVVNELRFSGNHSNLVSGTDLHGMINSPNMMRSIIPNQDYDFRRMVLVVDQLNKIQANVEANPAFAEWQAGATMTDLVASAGIIPEQCVDGPLGQQCTTPEAAHRRAFEWGARWDMIGYTDTGFTSDYLMMSPRSPTGGMGAVGTITEFAYSHAVPDNHWIGKLEDMHVAGVREIVRAQMQMAGRLDTPMLAGTGPVAYLDDGVRVTSDNNPNPYQSAVGRSFDPVEARFEFDQVAYDVSNVDFWRDLAPFSKDPIEALDAATFAAIDLAGYEHLVITNQILDSLFPDQIEAIKTWVEGGGHLLLTDSAIRFLDWSGITSDAVMQQCVYVGHSEIEDPDHALLDGVTWAARVTGEATAVGYSIPRNYPEWGVSRPLFETAGGHVIGTTNSAGTASDYHPDVAPPCKTTREGEMASLGTTPLGSGSIDLIGGALPVPFQGNDHRYGLSGYSVSALTYWFVMNSLGGNVEWTSIDTPFIPTYSYDPLYGEQGLFVAEKTTAPTPETAAKDSPGAGALLVGLALLAAALIARRR